MTEEIIIDGVDVAGCEFIGDIKSKFVKCTSWVHNSKKQVSGHWDCRENKNCYYKQLKRLEQERDELKQENERLKEKVKDLDAMTGIFSARLAEKYKSALEEIRIYINRCRNSLCDSNCEYWNNCKGNYNIDNILTKINEVLK